MRTRTAIMVLATSAALVVAAPQVASAAGGSGRAAASTDLRPLAECTAGVLCGNVTNRDDRHRLLITNDWPRRDDRSTWRTLRPGQDGRDVGVKDVDGLWVGPGCTVELAWGSTPSAPAGTACGACRASR